MKYRIFTLTFILAAFLTAGNLFAADLSEIISGMGSKNLDTRAAAEQQWQKICMLAGAPDRVELLASVNKQMCVELEKDHPVTTKVWLLHEMQWTGNADVVPTLEKLLADSDKRIREEAVRALVKNPSPETLGVLKTALGKADDADQKMFEDAIAAKSLNLEVGLESVSPMNLPYLSEDAVAKWMQGYEKLSNDEKIQTLVALTVRKDKKYREFVLEAIKSHDETLKKTGVLALEQLGTAEDVPVMLQLLFDYDQNLLTGIMAKVVTEKFDETLIKTMKAEKDPNRYLAVANILANRYQKAIIPDLVNTAKAKDCPNRLSLLGVLEQLCTKENVADLVDIVLLVPTGKDRDDAERVILRLCNGDAEPVVKKVTNSNMGELLPLMGRIGGEETMTMIKAELKSTNNVNRAAAFRALCNWPNAEVADDLLVFVENKQLPESIQIQALRSLVRVISLPDDQIGIKISNREKLETLKKAMNLATRIDEKRLVLDRASAVRDPETVKFALSYLDDQELAQNAARTIVELAHQDYLRKQDKKLFAEALEKVLPILTDQGLKDRVRKYQSNL